MSSGVMSSILTVPRSPVSGGNVAPTSGHIVVSSKASHQAPALLPNSVSSAASAVLKKFSHAVASVVNNPVMVAGVSMLGSLGTAAAQETYNNATTLASADHAQPSDYSGLLWTVGGAMIGVVATATALGPVLACIVHKYKDRSSNSNPADVELGPAGRSFAGRSLEEVGEAAHMPAGSSFEEVDEAEAHVQVGQAGPSNYIHKNDYSDKALGELRESLSKACAERTGNLSSKDLEKELVKEYKKLEKMGVYCRYQDILPARSGSKLLPARSGSPKVVLANDGKGNSISGNRLKVPDMPGLVTACDAPKQKALGNYFSHLFNQKTAVVAVLVSADDLAGNKAYDYFMSPGFAAPRSFKTINKKETYKVTSTKVTGDEENKTFGELHASTYDLTITNKAGHMHTCKILHVENWPDRAAPTSVAALALAGEVKTMAGDQAATIHCSAGVGRTGVVVMALDALSSSKLSLETSLNSYRDQRNSSFVQTVVQLGLVADIMKQKNRPWLQKDEK